MTTPPTYTREQLIARAQALAKTLGRRSLSQTQWRMGTGHSADMAKKAFGQWNAFIRAAGLEPNEDRKRIPDDDLMRALRDCCVAAGGVVSLQHVVAKSGYGAAPYRKRWGDWRRVLVALRGWCAVHDPAFPHLAALPERGGAALPKPLHAWPPPERRYGAPLNFRGVLHEPVNEAGVILLFGVLAQELGFAIEHVSGSFPDCEAKRRYGDVWERVRLEFEFESRNFKVHNHDPAGCDLVVCWSHNWPDCPVEVLELKAEVQQRMS